MIVVLDTNVIVSALWTPNGKAAYTLSRLQDTDGISGRSEASEVQIFSVASRFSDGNV